LRIDNLDIAGKAIIGCAAKDINFVAIVDSGMPVTGFGKCKFL
jgi:hypothetical protein